MMRCLSSTTVACSTTSSTCLRKTNTPLSEVSGFWAEFAPDGGAPCDFDVAGESATVAAGDWLAPWLCAKKLDRNSVVRSKKIGRRTLFRWRIVTGLWRDSTEE